MSDARLLLCCFALALLAMFAYGWLNRTEHLDCYPQQRSDPVSWTCVEGR